MNMRNAILGAALFAFTCSGVKAEDTNNMMNFGMKVLLGALQEHVPVPSDITPLTVGTAVGLGAAGGSLYWFARDIASIQGLKQALEFICLQQVGSADVLEGTGIFAAFAGVCSLYETGPELRRQLVTSILTALFWEQYNNPGVVKENEVRNIVLKGLAGVGALQSLMQYAPAIAQLFNQVKRHQRRLEISYSEQK